MKVEDTLKQIFLEKSSQFRVVGALIKIIEYSLHVNLSNHLAYLFVYLLVPIIQFVKSSYSTNEETGIFTAVLMRTGDLTYTSSVRCYTRSMTAQVQTDFKERSDTDESLIVFHPGVNRQSCPVTIVDDFLFEGKEAFTLKLGSVDSYSRTGERNSTVITVVDTADSEC